MAPKDTDTLGLECHSAPFSWKLIFESDQLLYELILCACSAREEQEWRALIQEHICKLAQAECQASSVRDSSGFENSVLCLDIKALGPIFGLPGTIARQKSIQRALTVDGRRRACQVIIKDTFSLKETGDSPVGSPGVLARSRSLMSTNHIPYLIPRRGDRQRLEQKMSDVWTRDRLPYPGMTGRKGGHLIRTSTMSLMRRISLAGTIAATGSIKRRTDTQQNLITDTAVSTNVTNPLDYQTDGALSLASEKSVSYPDTFWSTVQYQDPNPYAGRLSPMSGQYDEACEELPFDGEDRSGNRRSSNASTVVTHRHSEAFGEDKGKSRKSKTLLKAFSTESIRGWFHFAGA